MRKKLIISLKSLARDILSIEKDQDLDTLKKKTEEIYSKLVILEYLNKSIDSLETETVLDPSEESPESEIISKSEKSVAEKVVVEKVQEDFSPDLNVEENLEELETESEVPKEVVQTMEDENINLKDNIEEDKVDLEDLFEPKFDSIKEDFSLKDEFKDTISLDETENLFETKRTDTRPVSLNDKLLGRKINVGLNDRIAFVNRLFDFNQSDFNRILNELNAFETEVEAKKYIQNSVKKRYNWSGKEDIEERFIFLVERKFL